MLGNILNHAIKMVSKVGFIFLRMAHKYRILSDAYCFFSGQFSNEHQAVLKGRLAYCNSNRDIGITSAFLRRNIHRLEKGIIMRPRREVFGEGFILETVKFYVRAMESTQYATSEKKWAADVLGEYFKIVKVTPVIEKARQLFYKASQFRIEEPELPAQFPCRDASYKPYAYDQLPSLSINFEELKLLFIRRRSVRWFQDKSVPFDLVKKAVSIASFAPSACNRQPYRFLFCNERGKALEIARCAGGTKGFAENIPAMIVIVGDLASYAHERDRHLIFVDSSLATMQLMLALETLGLSTCSINWPEVDSNERKLRKAIELKPYERVVMLLAVGYADKTGGIPYSEKKGDSLLLQDISQ